MAALQRTSDSILRWTVEFGLIASIFIAVAGFGGTEPVSRAMFEEILFLLAMLLALTSRRRWLAKPSPALLCLAALAAWVFVQWFASRHGKIGFDTHAIETRALVFASAVTGFFITLELSRNPDARKRVAFALIAVAILESFYGFAQYPGGWEYIWTYRRIHYTGSATGTYINHNHFAGLLEMILPLTLALAFYYWEEVPGVRSRHHFRDFFVRLGQPELLKSCILLLASAVLFLAIVCSFSRMGLISSVASLILLTALAAFVPRQRSFNRSASASALSRVSTRARPSRIFARARLLIAMFILAIAGICWVGAGPVLAHFERLSRDELLASETGEGRLPVWRDTRALIRQHAFTGVGLGCFEYAYTRVQSTALTFIVDHAHNDYLELVAELGIPAAAALFALVIWLLVGTLRAAPAQLVLGRALGFGSACGIVALLVHSAADFNFYIPANALVFAVLLGLGYSSALDEAGRRAAVSAPAAPVIRYSGTRQRYRRPRMIHSHRSRGMTRLFPRWADADIESTTILHHEVIHARSGRT